MGLSWHRVRYARLRDGPPEELEEGPELDPDGVELEFADGPVVLVPPLLVPMVSLAVVLPPLLIPLPLVVGVPDVPLAIPPIMLPLVLFARALLFPEIVLPIPLSISLTLLRAMLLVGPALLANLAELEFPDLLEMVRLLLLVGAATELLGPTTGTVETL